MTFSAKHSSKSSVPLSKPTLDGNYCCYYNKKLKKFIDFGGPDKGRGGQASRIRQGELSFPDVSFHHHFQKDLCKWGLYFSWLWLVVVEQLGCLGLPPLSPRNCLIQLSPSRCYLVRWGVD